MNGIEELRADFPGWQIWRHEETGVYHARRRVESFIESDASRRRFHVAGATLTKLSVLLIAQAGADLDELGSIDQHTGQRGDGHPPTSTR